MLFLTLINVPKLSSFSCSTAAAAAAKSLQSCPTLSNPLDCSLPDSSVRGVFQATVLEWGAMPTDMNLSKLQEMVKDREA